MVIKLIGLVNGEPTEFDGKYVVDFDPLPRTDDDGLFIHLIVTDDAAAAKQFDSMEKAVGYYRQACGLRLDDEPDRPLTAFTVEICEDFL